MTRSARFVAAAAIATVTVAVGYSEISIAKSPAETPEAQAPRQGRGGNAGDSAPRPRAGRATASVRSRRW